MTLGEFKRLTDDLSDEIEVYIYVENILHPICLKESGVLTLRDINDMDEDVVALSVPTNPESRSTINLN
jgi:inorganic pyrophosphatase